MSITSAAALRGYQQNRNIISGNDASKPPGNKPNAPSGSSSLAKSVDEFSKVFETVETSTQALARGEVDAHTVVEALATAEVALEAAVTIRNRVVEAYQELLRMPI